MTKEEFDTYKFTVNTVVNFFEDIWDRVTEVNFEDRYIGVERGQYILYTEVKGIKENQWIKKQRIKKDYHGTDNTLIESTRIETNPEDVSMTSAEKRAYLQGAKDMWEAVKLKNEFGRYHDQTFEVFTHDIDLKAQQFIDSLKKEDE